MREYSVVERGLISIQKIMCLNEGKNPAVGYKTAPISGPGLVGEPQAASAVAAKIIRKRICRRVNFSFLEV